MNGFLKTSFLGILVFLSSCNSTKNGFTLSKFYINGKAFNRHIINRVPDYGDGHADGCIIRREMELSLTALKDSIRYWQGSVIDVEDRSPLAGAPVLVYETQHVEPTKLVTDSEGKFKYKIQHRTEKIEVQYIGYRTLQVLIPKK